MSDFSNAKVGDKVYSLRHGYGEINNINGIDKDFPISVLFNKGKYLFNLLGMYSLSHITPDLYHSKPTIIEAKRMVKKEIDVFLNVYSAGYKTKIDVDNGFVTPAKLTFEVEE